MDQMVLDSQVYLNGKYGSNAKYVNSPENGLTGWPTMYSMIRALQIELGLPSTSDAFGPGTTTAFQSQIGSLNSSTNRKNIVSILRCALWCKGYWGGDVSADWDTALGSSIVDIKTDLGLAASASVNAKLMKSLLTMDAYSLLPGGLTDIRSGQKWLNATYSGRSDFSITPCDGLYTRQMQQSLMYALQYELGMADGVANGNLGPGTTAGIKSLGSLSVGSSDSNKNYVRLFQLALCCNTYPTAVNGVFSTDTQAQVIAFQSFCEIDVTGTSNFGTWAELLVSSGDPDRPVSGMDTTSTMTAPFLATRWAEGYRVVGRYLTVLEKSIKPGELDVIFDAGFTLIPIFQNFNNGPEYFTWSLGLDHGAQAAYRARQLGIKENVIIFFAVDYDAQEHEAMGIVLDYFDGIRVGLSYSVHVPYRIGIYATRNVADIVARSGRADAIWVSGMSTGYSGNLGFPLPASWMYNQIKEIYPPINIDRNVVSTRAEPATRNDVSVVPLKSGSFHDLYWEYAKRAVIAENKSQDLLDLLGHDLPSHLLLAWQMEGKYDDGIWQIYAPIMRIVHDPSTAVSGIFSNFKAEAGTASDLWPMYEGEVDLQHASATCVGVMNWGSGAGFNIVTPGDLGGWALDAVQLWATWWEAGEPGTIASWVDQHFGTVGSPKGFGFGDVLADADGWLWGSAVASGPPRLEEAMRATLVSWPTPQERIGAFLRGRFGNSPDSLALASLKTMFDPLLWNKIPRDTFMKGAREPSSAELVEFSGAIVTKWKLLGGL